MITYKYADGRDELLQIIALQQLNLPDKLDSDEIKKEGFVTVMHDIELLEQMNLAHPHVIALDGEEIIGYALVMLPSFKDKIPVLFPLFQRIDHLKYGGVLIRELDYFVMGQVCIKKEFRGKGVFGGLYHKMRELMSENFILNVTSISTKNTRSIRAHEKVGFKVIESFTDEKGDWLIVAWDW